MKNISLLLKLGLVSAGLVSSLACSSQSQSSVNSGNAPNVVKVENNNSAQPANSNADTSNSSVAEASKIGLPDPRPIENGKTQTFYSNTVTYTVPAGWKNTLSDVLTFNFSSPDKKLGFSISVGMSEQKGDMMQVYTKTLMERPKEKISLLKIQDTLGVLTLLDGSSLNAETDMIFWESFPPPDSDGRSMTLTASMRFPEGEFEQNKQLISDILHSIRIKK